MKKLAFIPGHNSLKQGAIRKDTRESEWMFNSRLAKHIEAIARRHYPDIKVQTFFRNAGGGYPSEIKDVYRRVDAWGAHASIEGHFNSHDSDASGTETLISGSAASFKLGNAVNTRIVAALGLHDRGLITRKTGRGSQSLMAGKAPAILIEPFFGSSAKGLDATDTLEEEMALAHAILAGAAEAFGIMPRQNLEGSRTKVATAAQAKISKAQHTAGAGTVLSGLLESVSGDLSALPQIGPLSDYLPYIIAGLGISTAVLAYLNTRQTKLIDQYRAEDLEREIR